MCGLSDDMQKIAINLFLTILIVHTTRDLLMVVQYYCVSRLEVTLVFLYFNNFNPY